jgi:hypothetical protein
VPVLAAKADGSSVRVSSTGSPVRLAVLYMPNGVDPNAWSPAQAGASYEMSPILEPLSGFREDLLVLTELWNAAADTGDGHYVKTAGFLTGTTITRTTGDNLRSGGTSMDQVAAKHIGNLTMLPSLELGIEPVTTGVDTNVGYTRLYGSHIAWSSPTTPLAKEINPKLAFDRLFRREADRPAVELNRSVLDLVRADARRLEKRLGRADQQKLGEYFEAVRSVEKRIEFDRQRQESTVLSDPLAQRAIAELGARIDAYADPARVSERRGDHSEHVRLMLEVMVLAFWTDMTRISTFMFGNAVSGRNFTFIDGVHGSHHELSHHENQADKLEQYRLINRWHCSQLAYLLARMKSIREGAGTLLDNSMVLFGGGLRDGNSHSPRNLPIILAGRGGGTLASGRHLVYRRNTPLCNLYVSMLKRMGVPADHFGDSTGALPGLDDPAYAGTAA